MEAKIPVRQRFQDKSPIAYTRFLSDAPRKPGNVRLKATIDYSSDSKARSGQCEELTIKIVFVGEDRIYGAKNGAKGIPASRQGRETA